MITSPHMEKYDPKAIEKKWQDRWAETGVFQASEDGGKEKYYVLDMFPYPSAAGLHVGHPLSYTATDIIARKRRMEGFNVLHPFGWDSFGLPAENYAIKVGGHPEKITDENIGNFTRQIKSLGFSYDWSREVKTSSPDYYKWTQWLFLELYEKGLAYKRKAPVNWCESCKTVLANEQVEDGRCERCKDGVIQKELEQWFFKITEYADRLLEGLDEIDWPERIKAMQRNWIGRSEGVQIQFGEVAVFTTRPDTLFGVSAVVLAPEHPLVEQLTTDSEKESVAAYVKAAQGKSELERTGTGEREKTGVFTGGHVKHPLTDEDIPVYVADYALMGYGTGAVMVVPAHDERDFAFAKKYGLKVIPVIEPVTGTPQENPEHRKSIVAFVEDPSNGKVLTLDWGRRLGGHLLIGGGRDEDEDPEDCARREVLEETGYSDLEFVGKSETIHHRYFAHSKNVAREIDAVGLFFRLKSDRREEAAHEEDEKGKFAVEWLAADEAIEKISDELHAYVLRKFTSPGAYEGDGILTGSGDFDGLASEEAKQKIADELETQKKGERQTNYHLRDWLVSRQRYWGAPIPIIHCEDCGEVPVPEEDLPVRLPDDVDFKPTGESPLALSKSFNDVVCPKCGKAARREADTMDTFVDSSWYFLRYADAKNETAFAGPEKLKYWCPVDMYVGGAEHAVLHLLYSRFFTKALKDAEHLDFDEPFRMLRNQGMILGEDNEKMSKSRGNVVNPDEVVEQYGADTLRLYEMFMGEFSETKPWSTKSIIGLRRFIEKVWKLSRAGRDDTDPVTTKKLHKTIKKVSEDIEAFKFNTAISAMMIFVNDAGRLSKEDFDTFLKLLAPFAPHVAEELWEQNGNAESMTYAPWPSYDEALTVDDEVTVVVQVNGKLKDKLLVAKDTGKEELEEKALASEYVKKFTEGKEIDRVIVVPNRLVNITTK